MATTYELAPLKLPGLSLSLALAISVKTAFPMIL